MNRPILSCWIDQALAAEEESRELRALLVGLLVANARSRDPFRPEHVSKRDYFHPSVAGQRTLADVTWSSGYDFTGAG
ncbi:MAG: hypothetical protein H0U90_07835 [Actinobacteria bacterium]|nr:hypothetical protein [Actinomycetota bacterium]